MNSESLEIIVLGGGLVGPAFACMAADLGHRVRVIETRSDPRKQGYAGGRSINLALSARGLEALDHIGLGEEAHHMGIPMRGRMIHNDEGRLSFQAYSAIPGEAILSISRGELNRLLLDAASARPHINLLFDVDTKSIDLDAPSIHTADGTDLKADLIIGADGAGSMVRAAMHTANGVDQGTDFIESRYKELHIPPAEDGSWRMHRDALHIWPRGKEMMIALPNLDGSFTVTCFWLPKTFDALQQPDDIKSYFESTYPDAIPVMPTYVSDFASNPTSPLGTVHCSMFYHGSTAALLGDAAHAIVPFYGQGMNAGLQGALQLARSMQSHHSIREALEAYDTIHRPDATAIANLALSNYVEMRSHTASAMWRLRTRLEKQLNRLFPKRYRPIYNLVSFSTVRYSEAVEIAMQQQRRLLISMVLATLLVIGGLVALGTMA